jgi:hypothetical protein
MKVHALFADGSGCAVLGAGALALLVGAGLIVTERVQRTRAAGLERQVRAGEFAEVREPWLALPWVTSPIPEDARRELEVVVSLRSLITGARVMPEAGAPLVLGSEDRYRVEVQASRDCYLYAFQVDSWGGGTLLFPNPALSLERNPLRAGRRYAFPDGERWLVLDESPGKETVVVVAAPWPGEDLEALMAAVPEGNSPQPRAPEIFAALQERAVRRRAGRLEAGLRGLVYEEIPFVHR